MKIKWSGVGMVDGRGKINGSVASKNRAGAYVRTKVTPVNPNTSYQSQARALLTSLSQSWSGLTQAQRDGFNGAVSDFAQTDIFGDLRHPTGKNLYTRLNVNLNNAGLAQITDVPQPLGPDQVLIDGVTVNITLPSFEVAFVGGDADTTVQVWSTAPQSPGKSFVKSEYRLIGTFLGNTASPYDFEADYLARFGTPSAGAKVFVQLRPVSNLSGIAGTASSASTIVVS